LATAWGHAVEQNLNQGLGMARSLWTGAISFGLVNIPIKLFTAVSPRQVQFHQLHDADGARVRMQRVCTADGEEVPYEHVVRGYQLDRDHHVVIQPEELDALDPEATHTIDIESFVELGEIDPLYYDKTYYLVPEQSAVKAYALLRQAMQQAGKVGIARFVLRTRQSLCAVRPMAGPFLGLSTMYYADEVVAPETLAPPWREGALNERELQMAGQLIESLATKFDPGRYHDEYRERVLQLVREKAEGKEVVTQTQVEPRAQVIDLVTALKASLEAARRGEPPSRPSGTTTAKTPATRPAEAPAHGRTRRTSRRGRREAAH
jgi:DNA end-binding protein Ku